jgi:hypothetical protein
MVIPVRHLLLPIGHSGIPVFVPGNLQSSGTHLARRNGVALLCALAVQISARCHNRLQLATTRELNINKEMQGKCLSWLELGFWVEMSC